MPNDKQKQKKNDSDKSDNDTHSNNIKKNEDISIEDKLKQTEDKLLRSLAEIENQRRRFEKEIKMLLSLVRLILQRKVAILDNLQRAKVAIKNDDNLKNNKDLNKFLDNFTIIEKDCRRYLKKTG